MSDHSLLKQYGRLLKEKTRTAVNTLSSDLERAQIERPYRAAMQSHTRPARPCGFVVDLLLNAVVRARVSEGGKATPGGSLNSCGGRECFLVSRAIGCVPDGAAAWESR